ncbi:type II secretion system F family protein [Vreelandella massiliensis]|uniref:type II secretion system F family protein n=1 Tax=Vreelandella massiliensis TaxID=1816686 RepID=UPI0013564914|nr:type II secretion system F family protein [Halomonas massiliensis]
MSYGDRQAFLSRLAAMLASGVSAGKALGLLKATFSGAPSAVAGRLLDRMELGDNMTDAFQHLGRKVVPPATVAMIQAGSYTGASHEAIRNAMDFERTMHTVRKESGRGIWQAAGAFVVALLFILATIFGFLPYILDSPLMSMAGQEQDETMQTTVTFSYGVGYVMAVLFTIFMVFVLMGTVGRKVAPVLVDNLILKIPYYKEMVLARQNFIAFYALSLLVQNGVSMERALELMADNTERGALRKNFVDANKAVKRGQPWYEQFTSLEATDRASLGASLDRSQVSDAMAAISTQYRDLYAARMASLVPILQGISALFLLASGLLMFALTILPMLQMTTQVL